MKKRKIIVLLVLIMLLIGVFYGYQRVNEKKKMELEKEKTQEYKVTLMDIDQTYSTSGQVFSKVDKTIRSAFESEECTLTVEIGDVVKAGDLVGTLNDSDIRIGLLTQEKTIMGIESELNRLKSEGNKGYLSSLESARTSYNNAKEVYEKNVNLYSAGAISLSDLEASEDQKNNTYRTYDSERGRYYGFDLQNEIVILEKTLEIEQLRLAKLEDDYEMVRLTAENDGTIVGLFIESGDPVEMRQELYQIMDLGQLEIVTEISEYEIKDIKEGQEVMITTLGDESVKSMGRISKIYPSANVSGPDVTVSVVVDIPESNSTLKPGFSTNLEIMIASKKNAKVVPYDAIITSEKGHMIIKLVDGKEKKILVETGVESDLMIEVISDELNEGDTIIVMSTIDFSGEQFKDRSKMPGRKK